MSFVHQKTKGDELGANTLNENFTVKDLLSSNYLFIAISTRNKQVLEYIFKNFGEIINYAMECTDEVDPKLSGTALKLLLCNSNTIFVIKNHVEIFQKVMELFFFRIENGQDVTKPIIFLKDLHANYRFLCKITVEESNHFLEVLLAHIEVPVIYDFVTELVKTEKNKTPCDWFQMIATSEIIINLLENGNRMFFNIAAAIIDSYGKETALIKKFSSPDVITKLIETGLGNHELSEGCFLLVWKIIEKFEASETNQEEKGEIGEIKEYDTYIEILKNYLVPLLSFITSDSTFTPGKSQAVEIILMISNAMEEVPEEIFELCKFLFTILEENLTCNSLAKAFMNVVEDISNSTNRSEFDFMPICEWIMDITSRREEVQISFWGEVLEISRMINNMILFQIIPLPEHWEEFVTHYLLPKSKIIRVRYGGETIPEEEAKDMRHFCVDDYDAEVKLGKDWKDEELELLKASDSAEYEEEEIYEYEEYIPEEVDD